MTTGPLPVIVRDIPALSTVANDDGGLDIVAGGRVIGTLTLSNVEDFAGVTYYDLDVRGRQYVRMIEKGPALRAWTRLRSSGSDQVLRYLRASPRGES